MDNQTATPMIDVNGIQDIFISGLGEIEQVGGSCLRFVFYAQQHIGGRDEMIVVARLVLPMEAVGPAAMAALKAVGVSIVRDMTKLN